jgi:hypothetical protein
MDSGDAQKTDCLVDQSNFEKIDSYLTTETLQQTAKTMETDSRVMPLAPIPQSSIQDRDSKNVAELVKTQSDLGNDQVTVDTPRQPLVTASSIEDKDLTIQSRPLSVVTAKEIVVDCSKTVAANAAQNSLKTANQTTPFTAIKPNSAILSTTALKSNFKQPPEPALLPHQQIPAMDPALKEARAPLVNLYGPFLLDTDTCVQDARNRLTQSIEQTYKLRQAFTDRVYNKYRVCLYPPTSRMNAIRENPTTAFQAIRHELQLNRDEKELEKKHAAQHQQNFSQSCIDTAEQLLFYTAGLNLVILPEDNVDYNALAGYSDRAPTTSDGQRVKNISQAAATAGDIMLDRARKAASLRAERKRQFSGVNRAAPFPNVAPPMYLAPHPPIAVAPAVPQQQHRPIPPKANVSNKRNQSALSANALLSLAPHADEITHDKLFASTEALISRACISKTTQQRLKHPHPESAGGRRRATMTAPGARQEQEPFLEAYLQLTLPPLPATKERLERKPLPLYSLDEAASPEAIVAVKGLLELFIDRKCRREHQLKHVTKIGLLHGMKKLSAEMKDLQQAKQPPASAEQLPHSATATVAQQPTNTVETRLDPALTFSVLQAIGLIDYSNPRERTETPLFLRPLINEDCPVWSEKLKELRRKLFLPRETLTETLFPSEERRGLKRKVVPSEYELKTAETLRSATVIGRLDPLVQTANHCGGGEIAPDAVKDASEPGNNRVSKSPTDEPCKADESLKNSEPDDKSQDRPAVSSVGSKRKYSDLGVATPHAGVSGANSDIFLLAGNADAARTGAHGINQLAGHLPSAYGQHAIELNAVHPTNFGGMHLQMSHYSASSLVQDTQPAAQSKSSDIARSSTAGFGIQDLSVSSTVLGLQQQQSTLLGSAAPIAGLTTDGNVENKCTTELAHGAMAFSIDCSSEKTQPVSRKPESNINNNSMGGGLKFFEPKIPSHLPPSVTEQIKMGRFDEALPRLLTKDAQRAALEYLAAVGAAVPIPKALVINPLKERLNTPAFKNAGGSGGPIVPRDLITATLLVSLWANHERKFQQAFEKNGRIDVDSDCKWLVQVAIDTAVRVLTVDIGESMARGSGAFAEVARSKIATGGQNGSSSDVAEEQAARSLKKLELHTATLVSKALATELNINTQVDAAIPAFALLLEYLDEARLCALRARSQERAMLASLIARKSTMSEAFANAYTSSMIRAGEALGHGKFFEMVQDSDTGTCSLLPFDILTGEGEAWEDPCKPDGGFTMGLTGEELVKRAHARAMIHKSLRKLQDKHNIRGGASNYGPYVEVSSVLGSGIEGKASPRPGAKRRGSITEPIAPWGTGSGQAKSWTVHDPKHYCDPVVWYPGSTENTPYGLHRRGEQVRSLSLALSSRSGEPRSTKKLKQSSFALASSPPRENSALLVDERIPRSTREIDWADVAGIFQRVEMPKRSPSTQRSAQEGEQSSRTIFAPLCRMVDDVVIDNTESDTEEDLSDETVIRNHQVVLDDMKDKLSAFLEARRKHLERRKSKFIK